MELRDGLRMLRSEAGLTQTELAAALNVSYAAVSRWENGRSRPTRAASLAVLALARQRRVSAVCLECLNRALMVSHADDKADVAAKTAVSERMKLEQRELLTSEQLKMTLDNINIGVFGIRAYSALTSDVELFYFNQCLAQMMGYSEARFLHVYRGNPYVSIHPDDLPRYLDQLAALISGRLPLDAFDLDFRLFHEDGATLWVNVRAISAKTYSFGMEIFATCRDISARVEAERKYHEELIYRATCLRDSLVCAHCDLTRNAVLSFETDAPAPDGAPRERMADALLASMAERIPEGAEKQAFLRTFSREAMLTAFASGESEGSVTCFDLTLRRWLRIEYHLILNPTSGAVEALVHARDVHRQWMAKRLLNVMSQRLFDYIGCIDVETGACEICFESNRPGRLPKRRITCYQTDYPEMIRLAVVPEDVEATIVRMDLDHVRECLETAAFYSCIARMAEADGSIRHKKILFAYLDDTRRVVIIARSDLREIAVIGAKQEAELAAFAALAQAKGADG